MGRLYYRNLERLKIKQLKLSKGDVEAKLAHLPLGEIEEINFWNEALIYSSSKIIKPPVNHIIISDASLGGWGPLMGVPPPWVGGALLNKVTCLRAKVSLSGNYSILQIQ